jgi:hypothetical protein
MKRIVRIVGVGAAAGALLASAQALAGTAPVVQQEITFGDSFFSPAKPPPFGISQGAREVAWLGPAETNLPHNVHQDNRLFRSGPPSTTVEEYQTDIAAGKYHYYCQVHGSKAGGMDGVLKIRPVQVATGPESTGIVWADSEAEAKHRYRVEFRRVGGNRWKVWKKSTAQTGDVFGDGDPINANPDRQYQVRVRTFVKGDKQRRSGWSPKLTFSVGL